MVEVSLSGDAETARIGVAGDTLNTAVYLRRNWPGEVSYVTALGTDPMSDRIAGFIASQGISTGFVVRNADQMPGLYAIATDPTGERSFSYWRDTSAARRMFQPGVGPVMDSLADFDAVFLSAITLAILPNEMRETLLDWLAGYRTNGGRVIFDSNYRSRLWEDPDTARNCISRAWSLTDIGLPSVDDEMAIFGDANAQVVCDRLTEAGVTLGALKRGAEGPLALGAERIDQSYRPATHVVDTTAAGDSFNGGYLACWAGGGTLPEALLAGHECARRVVGVRGAFG